MPMTPFGTPMFPTSAACASVKEVKCCRLSQSTAAVSLACLVAKRRKRCTSSPLNGAAWTKLAKWRKHGPDKCSPSRALHHTPAGHRRRAKLQNPQLAAEISLGGPFGEWSANLKLRGLHRQ